MRAIHKIAVLGVALAAFSSIGMGTAFADPPSGTLPALTDITGVGSDTITPLYSGSPTENQAGSLVTDYNSQKAAGSSSLWSWDAVNPSTGLSGDTITTKGSSSSDTSCNLTRPNGSSAGITALNANQEDSTQVNSQPVYCIDFARSSRAPNTGTTDTFVSMGLDAINWTYPTLSGVTSPQPASLTLQDLINIYTCVDTNWDQTSTPGADAPIVPVLPQAGSGTRSTFLTALGISSSTTEPCWVNGVAPNGDAIEENTGVSPGNTNAFTQTGNVYDSGTASSADIVFPYSIGDWIAQGAAVTGTGAAGTTGAATVGGHANTSIWDHGNITQGTTVNDNTGVAEQPVVNNSFGQPTINYTNWEQPLQRTLYDVVRNGCPSTGACFPTTPSYEATALPAIFGPSGWLCTNVTAQSDEVSYGFTLQGNNCGTLSAGI